MKIAVCFKAVPDFDQVVESDWNNFGPAADWGYVRRVFSCFDENALETALRLRSAWEALWRRGCPGWQRRSALPDRKRPMEPFSLPRR